MTHETTQEHPGKRIFVAVWLWLLALTMVEVFLAYRRMSVAVMLAVLMGLSVIKAGLIMAYFMHLRYERFSLALTLIPMLIICIALMTSFFPDSLRLVDLGGK